MAFPHIRLVRRTKQGKAMAIAHVYRMHYRANLRPRKGYLKGYSHNSKTSLALYIVLYISRANLAMGVGMGYGNKDLNSGLCLGCHFCMNTR